MKSEIITVIFIWIVSFIIYGIWSKYIEPDNQEKEIKGVEKKGKIKNRKKVDKTDTLSENKIL